MAGDTTTIQVSVELWQWLNGRKRLGETFDDVLRRELPISAEGGKVSADGGAASPGSRGENDRGTHHGSGDRVWYRCGYCGTVFEVSGALDAHVEDNHSEATIHAGMDVDHDVIVRDEEDEPYYCPDCDLALGGWEAFLEHNERQHGRDATG